MAAEWIRRKFVAEVIPAFEQLGCTRAQAIHAAAVGAALSDWGRITPGYNYWDAETGDMGPMLLVRARRYDAIATGGLYTLVEPIGWFSSPSAAARDALARDVLTCAIPAAEWQEVRRIAGES